MNPDNWIENIDRICQNDNRYHRDAYLFMQHVIDYTARKQRGENTPNGHVSGQELLEGIREYALQQYGPMTFTILNHWGIYQCKDIGNIVFNMVNSNLLGKTENDKLEDFESGFDFSEAFQTPFRSKLAPNSIPALAPKRTRSTKKRSPKSS